MGEVWCRRNRTPTLCHIAAAAMGALVLAAWAALGLAAVSTTAEGADAEVARLRDFLTGPDRTFATRRDAAQVLVEKETTEARSVLLEVLSSPAPSEATRAVLQVLASRAAAAPALVAPLFHLLESDDADIRRAAADAFGAYQGDEKVLSSLQGRADAGADVSEARPWRLLRTFSSPW